MITLPTMETVKRSLLRALYCGLYGAATSFALIPINLEDPKKYLLVLGIGLGTGFLSGVQKFISGYKKYDLN